MQIKLTKLVVAAAIVAASFSPLTARAQAPKPATVARPSQTEAVAKPAQIDKAGLLILIRSTLNALDLANKSGNYTILREISAPGFASVNDAARLSQIFRTLREQNADLSGVLVYEPQLTVMPRINKDGFMEFAGFFPSATNQIKFEMIFAPVNGRWKLFGLFADLAPAGPAAPVPAPQTAAPSMKR